MIPKQRKIRKNYMNKVAINFINEFGLVRLAEIWLKLAEKHCSGRIFVREKHCFG